MQRGGAREGSGRKPVAPSEKRAQMIITVSPETRERLKALAQEQGIAVGRIIDNMVK